MVARYVCTSMQASVSEFSEIKGTKHQETDAAAHVCSWRL